jgi:nitrite reductase (NADH) large subunit
MLALVALLLPGVGYLDSVQGVEWDRLWRDGAWKQASGFSVLGLSAVGLALSLRKRTPLVVGTFDVWRGVHVALGAAALAALFVHTGARLGARMDAVLMASFCALGAVGGAGAGVIALEHRLAPSFVRRWRRRSVWLHIVLFWPVPVLLAFHVLKSYWF